jgi:hypothetical protein
MKEVHIVCSKEVDREVWILDAGLFLIVHPADLLNLKQYLGVWGLD